MRVISSAGARTAYLALTLVILLAGDAVRFTTGWWTFGALALVAGAASVALLIINRDRWRIGTLPYPLLAFIGFATLSIAWSFYPAATALGLLTTWLIVLSALATAVSFSWSEIVGVLGLVLRAILALSLLFELFVSVVIRGPILPLFTQPGVDYSKYEKLPQLLYWSRNELFEVFDEGRIQGIVGNANNLGMLALLAVIVFAGQLADRSVRRSSGAAWLSVAGLVLVFTRSATVTVTIVVLLLALAALLLVRRARTPRRIVLTYAGIIAVVAVAFSAVLVFQRSLLGLLGKSPDLTGRFGIWEDVIAFAQQRPGQGWGWVSYWMPWAPPFDNLTFRYGVRQLQAHNVWIDVWFQLGIIGLVLFAALVVSTFARSWQLAVDPRQSSPDGPQPYRAAELLPVLLLAALLVQSVAESRLIVEYGIFFLALISITTKNQHGIGEGPLNVGRVIPRR